MTPLDRSRLVKVLGMLGSTHDGEVVAAARLAEKLRREADATWHDIVQAPAPVAVPTRPAWTLSLHEQRALWVRHANCCLSGWERDFLRSWRVSHKLTWKQLAVVARVANRLAAAEECR